MKDTSVKKEELLDLRKSQDSVFVKTVYMVGYDWKDLNLRTICKLVTSFEIYFGFSTKFQQSLAQLT
jgi:hypothetical protein